ncbi:ABC transporter ATP-binding protein [Glaciibacter sp. 2TAF33]|uniref:ABC transporter ATP-binding protein n=1 Tax=Glaciibacter sp. 2TAF33 TaxID=3233015 RepID=UPI003F91755B
MTTLRLQDVSIALGGLPVLSGVSLVIPSGTRTALVGASGSGKTTLLRLIAGFSRPDNGTITLDDTVVSGPHAFLPAHRRGVGYVPQDGALFPHLTVEQNIRFGLARGEHSAARIAELAELVALPVDLLRRYPHEISGGQQQRVSVARALAPAPKMIVLDEPFSALDTGLREQSRMAVIAALEASDATAVLVTHDQDEALMFGQQIGILAGGRLEQHGSPLSVFDNPSTAEVATFLGDAVFVAGQAQGTWAETAFGSVPLRHQNVGSSADATGQTAGPGSAIRVLLRPSQLTLGHDGAANGKISSLSLRGTRMRVEVEAIGLIDRVVLNVPAAEASYRVGDRVTVVIHGSGVSY